LEFGDCAGERAAAGNQFAYDTHLDLLLAPCEPASDALEMRRPVESSRRHNEGRVELMQVPAQSLLRPAALVDEILAVIDQQLEITKWLLIGPWPAQARLAQRGSGDRERIDRVRLAARPASSTLRRHQLRRHPHQLLSSNEQLPLERSRQ